MGIVGRGAVGGMAVGLGGIGCHEMGVGLLKGRAGPLRCSGHVDLTVK